MDAMSITIGISVVSCIGGLTIGYYKARVDDAERYVSKDACEKCEVRTSMGNVCEDMKGAVAELKRGNRTFTALRIDLAVIKTRLGIKSDSDEVRSAMASLELEGGEG